MPIKTAILLYIAALLLTAAGYYLDTDSVNTGAIGTGIEFALTSVIIYAIVVGLYEGIAALLRIIHSFRK